MDRLEQIYKYQMIKKEAVSFVDSLNTFVTLRKMLSTACLKESWIALMVQQL